MPLTRKRNAHSRTSTHKRAGKAPHDYWYYWYYSITGVVTRQLPVGKVSSLSHPYSLHMKGYQVVLLVFALKLPGINTTCYTYHDIGKLKNKYIHIYIYFFLNHNTQVHACNYSTKKEHLCCKTNPDINWSTEVMSFSNTHTKKKRDTLDV